MIQPIERLPRLLTKCSRYPQHNICIVSARIRDQFAKMSMVRSGKLILNDHMRIPP